MEKSIFTPYWAVVTENLREMRKRAGLSQRELARKWKTKQTIIARLEQGQRRLDIIEFYLLCKALKLDPIKLATEVLRQCQALDRAGRRHQRKV